MMEIMEEKMRMMENQMTKMDQVINQQMDSILEIQMTQIEQRHLLNQLRFSVNWLDGQLKQQQKQQQQMEQQIQLAQVEQGQQLQQQQQQQKKLQKQQTQHQQELAKQFRAAAGIIQMLWRSQQQQ